MAVASFEELCAGFCEIVNVSPPPLKSDDEGRVAFHVDLRGVAINLVHCPATSPDHLFVLFSLGPLGEDDDTRTGELQALLNANFVLQVHPPTFSRNPATGDAVLQYVYPLFEATPSGLLELIELGVDWSSRWHENLASTPSGDAGVPWQAPSHLALLNFA